MKEYYAIKEGNFSNYMHFGHAHLNTAECFSGFQAGGEAFLASPLLSSGGVSRRGCSTICSRDLRVRRGSARPRMAWLSYHPLPDCGHIAGGGPRGSRWRSFALVLLRDAAGPLAFTHPETHNQSIWNFINFLRR